MNIYESIISLKEPSAVALGHFDGLHKGHQLVIKNAVRCKKNGLSPTVLTFSENPACIVSNKKIPYLMTSDDKISMLENLGVENLFNLNFRDFMSMSAQTFVEDILHKQLNAKRVYCGFNYHFGRGGKATTEELRELCSEYGIEVVALPPAMYKEEPISSTRIRHYLKQGRILDANEMLGREFSYNLVVCKGKQLGRKIGTPTFNQPFPEQLILPRFGVYVTSVELNGKVHCGVTNIGVKPTIGSDCPLAETWIPNFNCGELYGEKIEIKLIEFLRAEKKFNSILELKASILSDGAKAQKVFNKYFEIKKNAWQNYVFYGNI